MVNVGRDIKMYFIKIIIFGHSPQGTLSIVIILDYALEALFDYNYVHQIINLKVYLRHFVLYYWITQKCSLRFVLPINLCNSSSFLVFLVSSQLASKMFAVLSECLIFLFFFTGNTATISDTFSANGCLV